MSAATLNALIARCRTLCLRRPQETDAELLRRFARQRDAAAFEELIERYAPLVWGVCRRISPGEADSEDAFQATFLALVRQAGSLDSSRPLGGWLHTVAVRVAHKARSRSRRQRSGAVMPEKATTDDVVEDVSSRELLQTVDEEIEQLPHALRLPIILCCLHGRTRDEAAEAIGCSVAAIKSRLERGRSILRRRLERRGIGLPVAFLVLGLTGARVRASLWAKTIQLARNSPSPSVAVLAQAGLRTLSAAKLKMMGMGLAALLMAAGTAGVIGQALTTKQPETPAAPPPRAKVAAEPKKAEAARVRTDRHGDPLPDGAIARLGTVRWRHGDLVHALAYSPDGKRIVTTGAGRALVLWDAATGKEVRVFPNRGQPRGVAFSPDGKLIATTWRAGQLWDAATGKMLRELPKAQNQALALAFAPDGKILATANADGAVYLWDPSTGEKKRHLDCGQGGVNAVAYSPDGATLASGSNDGVIRLWDAATGKERRRFSADKKAIWSLVFSPDSKHLAVGSNEDSPRLWDMATGRQVRTFGDKQGLFAPLAFSPDGKLLASGYLDGTFRLWDAANGEEKRHWRGGSGVARSLAFSPDGKTLTSAVLWDGGIRLWDVATGREQYSSEAHHGPISLLRFGPDKGTLISVGFDRNILGWDVAAQTSRRQLTWTTYSFNGFALSPDGNTLAAGDHKTHEVWLWDVRTGKAEKLPGKHQNWIQTIAFSPDGRLVASGGRDDTIHIWDVRTGKEVRQIKGLGSPISRRLLFSPDGKTLACGTEGFDGNVTLRLWEVASGKERRVFDNQGAGISPDAFSSDGKVLASASNPPGKQEAFVRLWDMTTGKELCRHGGHRTSIGAVAFSPDGKLVVSGNSDEEDNSIHVWEAATGRLIRRFEGHHSWVFAVTFAPDGLTVASSAGDSTVLLWDITGRQKDGKLRPAALTPRQLDACWTALTNEDANKAYDAVWALVASAEQAVPFLQEHLRPVPRPDTDNVARMLKDLDSDDFKGRQRATEKLTKLGDAIIPDLQRALDGKPSLEVRKRLQKLLDEARLWTPERLRDHRAIQALEHIDTRQAKELLEALATGAPDTLRTDQAKAALRRSFSRR
ncbi:MAG TPA: sigma-70 family RNA polymerase sigma factor [Gemmataceae bacterium]|jgi:RNA polymerase sigma factor (sigma-70 family)